MPSADDGEPTAGTSSDVERPENSNANSAAGAATHQPNEPPKYTNRLAKETSPYLLLHKHNPVDWYPWGPEAFEKARREDKPIFLSIGYSACYWCHVMERESFADEAIAKVLNEHFVCIKVDREELPDVDEVYMNAVQLMTGRGGWPLSIFLTPERKPFYGGTYWPPRDRGRLPGFTAVLDQMITAWKEQREIVVERSESTVARLQHFSRPRGFSFSKLDRQVADHATSALAARFDPEYGGFGFDAQNPRLPKFPQPPILEFLAYMARHEDDARARAMLLKTLDHIGRGGIRDHLGGGFHRYSTDRYWRVPHFEKMLYDNAQLARVYLEAFEFTSDDSHAKMAKTIFTFIAREMTAPDGGFYSALDAESEHEEGKYYVWTEDEVKQLMSPAEFRLFAVVNGISGAPHIQEPGQPGRYVIHMPDAFPELARQLNMPSVGDLAGALEPAARRLIAVRNKRPRPLTDTKIMTDWNALMIAAYADGYRLLKDDSYRAAAERAAEFILTKCRASDGRLLHIHAAGSAKIPAYLEDHAFLAQAMLALERATGDERWLREARKSADEMVERFWDESAGGFFNSADDQGTPLVRFKSPHDGVLPSGNSAAIRALVALAERVDDDRYAELAGRALATFAGTLGMNPSESTNMVRALCEYLDAKLPPAHLAMRASDTAEPAIVRANAIVSVDKLKPGREFQVAVIATISRDWHIYANPSSKPEFSATTLTLTSDLPLEDVRIRYPEAQTFRADGVAEPINVYSGQALFRATATLSEKADATAGELRLAVRFQACNDQRCLAPKTIEVILPISIAGPDESVQPLRPDIFGPASQQD
jgi:hypothetical protein